MSRIKYSKNFKIEYKVITNEDIDVLSELFREQFSNENDFKRIKIIFEDDSEIESDDIDIFKSNDFKRKIAKRINFHYISHDDKNKLDINLCNSILDHFYSEVQITSYDDEWYHSICDKMKTKIDEIKPQCKISKYSLLLNQLVNLIETILFTFASYNLFFYKYLNDNYVPQMFALFILIFFIFVFINFKFDEKINLMYPEIEFDFGPEHLNKTKKLKKACGIIIPFIFDLILFILGLL